MWKPLERLKRLEPKYYGAFRCIGAACEDTCCIGWRVPVDKETFEKYQGAGPEALNGKLQTLVQLNPKSESDEGYGEITLKEGVCPFLSEGLCEIHGTLGEDWLSKNCATYPRSMVEVDGVIERSLHFSCPEAARLALTNPEPMQFVRCNDGAGDERFGVVGVIDTADGNAERRRRRAIELLQDRNAPLRERLFRVGELCAEIEGVGAVKGKALAAGERFETIIQLILARMGSDATGRRFRDCYQAFMKSLDWTMESAIEGLAERLDSIRAGAYAKFRAEHGYMLEHYLVGYAFRNLFPFGIVSVNRKAAELGFVSSPVRQYQVMVVHFVIAETLLAGLSGGEGFGVDEALRVMQSVSKTFEHAVSYPARAMAVLGEKGLGDWRGTWGLVGD